MYMNGYNNICSNVQNQKKVGLRFLYSSQMRNCTGNCLSCDAAVYGKIKILNIYIFSDENVQRSVGKLQRLFPLPPTFLT